MEVIQLVLVDLRDSHEFNLHTHILMEIITKTSTIISNQLEMLLLLLLRIIIQLQINSWCRKISDFPSRMSHTSRL